MGNASREAQTGTKATAFSSLVFWESEVDFPVKTVSSPLASLSCSSFPLAGGTTGNKTDSQVNDPGFKRHRSCSVSSRLVFSEGSWCALLCSALAARASTNWFGSTISEKYDYF